MLLLLFLLLILFVCSKAKVISYFTIPRARGCGVGDGQTAESCARYYGCIPYGAANPSGLPYCDARF